MVGNKDIRKIDGDLLEKYKLVRISGSNGWRKVELSTVHRQLSTGRDLFNIAIPKKWLSANPFEEYFDQGLCTQDGNLLFGFSNLIPSVSL